VTQPSRHSVSVSGVVVNEEGKVLVVQRRDTGKWEIPGGVLELDESIHDGLRREVREETGIEITPGALTGVYKNMKVGVIALVFRATHTDQLGRHTLITRTLAGVGSGAFITRSVVTGALSI
jgi:8-oxo-dGTP diphosphatase